MSKRCCYSLCCHANDLILIHLATLSAFENKLCSVDIAMLERGPPRVPISWVSLSPFDKMEFGQDAWVEMVTPQDLPFNWKLTPKLSMKEALFWKLTFQDNHGHLLGEHGPIIHNLMCSYLNRCVCLQSGCSCYHSHIASVVQPWRHPWCCAAIGHCNRMCLAFPLHQRYSHHC